MICLVYSPRAGRLIRACCKRAVGVVCLSIAVDAPIFGQNPLVKALAGTGGPTDAPAETNSIATPAEQLEKVRAELSETAATDPSLRRTSLLRLAQLHEQEISYTAELESFKAQRAEVAKEAASWNGFSAAPPYSVALTDTLRETIQVERAEIATGESALKILQSLIEDNRAALKQSEEKIRRLNDELESSKQNHEAHIRERDAERLHSRVALAMVKVLELERQIRNERIAGALVRLDLAKKKLIVANASEAFTEDDLQKVRSAFQAQMDDVQRELGELQSRRGAAVAALGESANRLQQTPAQTTNQFAMFELRESAETRRAQLETIDTAVNVLRFMLQADTIAAAIWESRFDAYRSRNLSTLHTAENQLHEFRARVALWKTYYSDQLQTVASRIALHQERLAKADASTALAATLRERLDSLSERDRFLLRAVRHVERGDRLLERFEDQLRQANDNLPFFARLGNAVTSTRSLFGRIWNFELLTAQDTIVVDGQSITGKRSVTFGKIISVILILVFGYWVTSFVSQFTEPIAVKRFKIDLNQAMLIQRWVRVALLTALALFSLAWVKIPLTVFAFAGGALAIALGFGMQTLLKNFVCGIIILFERPFRVGDVLDVAGQKGIVTGIGTRSSVLQLWDGTETLIPNSALLENSVTNWTYTNCKVRFTISVGVAYGSDIRRVVQILTEVVERHGVVEKSPQPQILLVDFAASALNFEIRFWVDVVKGNSAQISSDLRQMIASALAESGISIAFPQQDIHFDPKTPLQVHVVTRPTESTTENGERHAAAEQPRREMAKAMP
jgi:potassium efflux system protein